MNAEFGEEGAEAVYVVEDSRAMRRPVITGLRQADRIEILTGLTDGETVIVAGHNSLREGATVRITNPPGDTRQVAADSITAATASVQSGDRP